MRRRRTSLSRRLVAGLLLLTLLVSVVVTAIQLAADYQRRASLLREGVNERVAGVADVLAASVWNVDEVALRMLLDGLGQNPGVSRVELTTLDGDRFTVGEPPGRALAMLRFDLTHAPAGGRKVGTLTLTLDDLDIRERVAGRLRAITLTTLAVVLSGCVAIFLLVQHLLVRHLERIGAYVRTLDLRRLDQALVLERPVRRRADELDLVVEGFDRMRSRLAEEVAVQQRHEAELVEHREHLKRLVDERTDALAQRNIELETRTLELEVERARALALANTDHLTGVGNRRHFYEAANATLADAAAGGRAVGLLMLDVDHFKRVNDRHGHGAGDRVLVEVATRLRAALPTHALIGRLGGEEFAAVLVGIRIDALPPLAEQVRAAIATEPFAVGDAELLSCSASLGLAASDDASLHLDQLLQRADEALYLAKRGGRNRVVVWSAQGAAAASDHAGEDA